MKTIKNLLTVHVIAGLAMFCVMGLSSLTFAQEYPTRSITMYCPFGAGGSVDVLGRALAMEAEKTLVVPIVFETNLEHLEPSVPLL